MSKNSVKLKKDILDIHGNENYPENPTGCVLILSDILRLLLLMYILGLLVSKL